MRSFIIGTLRQVQLECLQTQSQGDAVVRSRMTEDRVISDSCDRQVHSESRYQSALKILMMMTMIPYLSPSCPLLQLF
jgi:hypothetical protein